MGKPSGPEYDQTDAAEPERRRARPGAVIPAFAGIGAAVTLVALVLALAPARDRLSADAQPAAGGAQARTCDARKRPARRRRGATSGRRPSSATRSGRSPKRDARQSRSWRQRRRPAGASSPRPARPPAASPRRSGRRRCEPRTAIVREAEELAEETRRELVSLLRDLLSQARAGDEQRPTNVYPLGGAHDARADAPDQAR